MVFQESFKMFEVSRVFQKVLKVLTKTFKEA